MPTTTTLAAPAGHLKCPLQTQRGAVDFVSARMNEVVVLFYIPDVYVAGF